MALLIENNAYSRLAASLAAGGTTLTVDTGTGDRFPIAVAPNYFKLTLQDAANNIEIIKVSARAASSDAMTIERAQEGTTARAWSIGDIVELRLTAGVTAPLQVLEEANTAALIRGKIDVPTRTGGDASGSWNINSATATALQTARTINGVSFNGTANITITANTPNSLTFNNTGAGGASGSLFNGAGALTVSYNTVGAPSTTGANASGTWGINITGNAATATTATNQSGGTVNATSIAGTSVNVAANGAAADPFGASAVTNPANANNYSYFGLTRAGNIGLGVGITGTTGALGLGPNAFVLGGGTSGAAGTVSSPWIAFNGTNFVASGSITANGQFNGSAAGLTGTAGINITGNAATATTLQTARTINGVSFNGSANISVNLNNSLTAGNGLTGTTFNGGAASTFAIGTPSSVSNTSTNSVTATSHTHALDGELVTTTAGSPAYYGARAFVNFNGTGTVSIRNSQNVSSITDNAVGAYTVNLGVGMPDANYSVNANAGDLNSSATVVSLFRDEAGNIVAPTVSAFRIITSFDMGAGQRSDNAHVCVSVFR
jgi:hypothetical protein